MIGREGVEGAPSRRRPATLPGSQAPLHTQNFTLEAHSSHEWFLWLGIVGNRFFLRLSYVIVQIFCVKSSLLSSCPSIQFLCWDSILHPCRHHSEDNVVLICTWTQYIPNFSHSLYLLRLGLWTSAARNRQSQIEVQSSSTSIGSAIIAQDSGTPLFWPSHI